MKVISGPFQQRPATLCRCSHSVNMMLLQQTNRRELRLNIETLPPDNAVIVLEKLSCQPRIVLLELDEVYTCYDGIIAGFSEVIEVVHDQQGEQKSFPDSSP